MDETGRSNPFKKNQLNLDKTKNTHNISTMSPKSMLSMSDMNKFFRREETYKKKLKTLIQTNSLAEAKIKIYESSIKQQRSTLKFQLNELSKTMNSKISAYVDQKLDRDRLLTNQMAHETIKELITKYEEVQKQTKVNKNVYENLNNIYEHYLAYSEQIEKLVLMTQKSNKQYEDSMKNMLEEKQREILNKKYHNQDLSDDTQTAIKKIEEYQQGRIKMIQEQNGLQKYFEKLLLIQAETKHEVQKFNSWAKIVIDKNHRKVFLKQNKQKQLKLIKQIENNNKLGIYLHELQSQEKKINQMLKEKENQAIQKEKARILAERNKLKKNKNQLKA